jgi:hypothetical protein
MRQIFELQQDAVIGQISFAFQLSSGCSRNSFSRVPERAGFPYVLLTIHLARFRKMVRTDTPNPPTTRLVKLR